MGSIYPQELIDVEQTQVCIRNCYASWMNDSMNDKNFAEKMGGFLAVAQHDLAQFKERYRREARATLELTGKEVAT